MLTVDHVIHRATNEKPQLLVFAGDTAGRISMWNITTHVKRYLKQAFSSQSSQCGEITREDAADETEFESSSKKAALSTVPEVETQHHVTKARDCHVTDRDQETLADANSGGCHACRSADLEEDTHEQSHHDNDNGSSSDDAEDEDVASFLLPVVSRFAESTGEEARAFSCMTLVEAFLGPPVHVFKAHQSGVNCACLVARKGTCEHQKGASMWPT